ncbi:hypothetical protein ENSA7_25140 [Enhygromyxa salina]|uniref:Uncharacterized protein n=1 Tax=Enhygromyxa salina TaxID=215803 RepID=A0A2S9YRN2_9BACT|nr:hypothetical protein ENSA7_25140 [Enhygromyxa salina]
MATIDMSPARPREGGSAAISDVGAPSPSAVPAQVCVAPRSGVGPLSCDVSTEVTASCGCDPRPPPCGADPWRVSAGTVCAALAVDGPAASARSMSVLTMPDRGPPLPTQRRISLPSSSELLR